MREYELHRHGAVEDERDGGKHPGKGGANEIRQRAEQDDETRATPECFPVHMHSRCSRCEQRVEAQEGEGEAHQRRRERNERDQEQYILLVL